MGDFMKDYGAYVALGATVLIAFFNWRTAVAAKNSPLHERLKETIGNNKAFADRIGDRLDQFFTELIPQLISNRERS